MTLTDLLVRHEGEVLHLYRDTRGNMTGGVGHNYDALGVSRGTSRFQLAEDIARAIQGLTEAYEWFPKLDSVRQDAITDMAFNLGVKGIGKFVKMIAAIRQRDWQAASNEMLESDWRREVGDRALDLAEMMLEGRYPNA